MKWTANWIWHPALECMDNLYVYARREVTLEAVPSQVTVAVTAGSLYQLYVNGQYVGRGPNPGDPSHYYYDCYDVTPYLRPGPNALVAICNNYGAESHGVLGQNWGRGGFLLEMRADDTPLLVTDGAWRVRKADPWDQQAPLNCSLYGDFKEIYDSRREIDGWMLPGFAEEGWLAPDVLGVPPVAPYTQLIEREIPMLDGAYVYPENTYWESASLTYQWADDWEIYHEQGLNADARGKAGRRPVEISKTHDDFAPAILCDFGRDVTGYPEIHLRDSQGGTIDVLYGEDMYLTRVDRFILKGGPQRLQPFNRRTFRYLKLVFSEVPAQIQLDEVSVRMNTYPVEYAGSFACSDSLLTRIWEVGRYTMHLSMLDHFVDCPWRERTIYGGDVYAENLIAHYAFGDPRLNRKTLRQIFALQYPEGALPPYGPYRGGDGFYPAWTAYFALAFVDHYDLTGDRAFLEEGWPALAKVLEWTIGQLEQNRLPLIGDPAHGGSFPEWMAQPKDHYAAWSTMPFYRLLQHSARLAEETMGLPDDAARYRAAAARMAEALLSHIVDPQTGQWAGEGGTSAQYDNALLLWSGMLSCPLLQAAAQRFDAPEVRPINSPFEGLFLLMGLYAAGEDGRALRFIREYWGELLARGATTFWEHFCLDSPPRRQPERGVSLCHGWSAAPTYVLPAYVLGVTPVQPGFREVAIAPHLADLSWAHGMVPTPQGPVCVDWTRDAAQFRLRVVLPTGTTGRVSLPSLYCNPHILLDGASVPPATDAVQPAILLLGEGEHAIVVTRH